MHTSMVDNSMKLMKKKQYPESNDSNTAISSQPDLSEDKATINVYSRDDNGYRELSNFSIRPFTLMQKNSTTASFKSVEQAFNSLKQCLLQIMRKLLLR